MNLSFKYNSDGLRTKKISPTSTTEYYYSGDILLAQYDGTDWMKFIYSADGEIVGLRYKDKSYYYIKNLQGDVIGILDELADIVCDYHYDAWGQCTISIPAGLSDDAVELANKNPIRYRGYYYDTETEFYYACSRYYHPEWGRFVNPDTIDIVTASLDEALYDKNLFAYCDNNPTIRIDSTGYFWETAFDIASLAMSATDVIINPADPWAWASLIGDAIDLVPFITGVGEIAKSVKVVVKTTDNATDAINSARKLYNSSNPLNKIRSSTGSYEIIYESGKNYVGKGGFSRAITSAAQHAKPNKLNNFQGDKVLSIGWTSSHTPQGAFVNEALLQQKMGVNNANTYNLIWSPGKRYL